MVFDKNHFENRYVALETPSRPPPFMPNAILNFHFDYWHLSLTLPPWAQLLRAVHPTAATRTISARRVQLILN